MQSNTTKDVDVIASRLRILRAESGLAKGAWAKRMGVSPYLAYRWLNGQTMPSEQSLVRISRKSEVSIPWLLGETEEREDL